MALRLVTSKYLKLNYKKKELEELLEDNRFSNLRLVVISVTGRNRTGKTFLINLLLLYAYNRYGKKNKSPDAWLNNIDEQFKGFEGNEEKSRKLLSILMWPTLYVHENMAILFLDTEGLTNISSGVSNAHAFLAMAATLSSVLIYNTKHFVSDVDLEALESAAMYGELVARRTKIHATPQKLLLLVRDWPRSDEYQYGRVEEPQHIQKLYSDEQKSDEMKRAIASIDENYEEVEYFAMPHIGAKAATSMQINFREQLSNIGHDFKTSLQELVALILAPENLQVKQIRGQDLRVKHFSVFMTNWAEEFNKADIPLVQADFNTNLVVNLITAREAGYRRYNANMVHVGRSPTRVTTKRLQASHERAIGAALEAYNQIPRVWIENSLIARYYRASLMRDLELMYEEYMRHNDHHPSLTDKMKMLWQMFKWVSTVWICWGVIFLASAITEWVSPKSLLIEFAMNNDALFITTASLIVIGYILYNTFFKQSL